MKSIRVSEETYNRLAQHGTMTMTFEDVIKLLLDYRESTNKTA